MKKPITPKSRITSAILEIPFKIPTINHIYGRNHGRQFITKEGKEIKKKIHDIVFSGSYYKEMIGDNEEMPLLFLYIGVYEDWYTKGGVPKRRDIDNRIKFVQDCLFEAFGIDDKYVFNVEAEKCQCVDREYSRIIIQEYIS